MNVVGSHALRRAICKVHELERDIYFSFQIVEATVPLTVTVHHFRLIFKGKHNQLTCENAVLTFVF